MKINLLQYSKIANFKSGDKSDKPIVILGSSSDKDSIMSYMDLCSEVTKSLVLADKKIMHGCGTAGIMGRAYNSAKTYSKKDANGKPEQNLAIIVNPMWGDEDLENCIPIKTVNSEAERIDEFVKAADCFVIFPGSATTIQEATTLIAKNNYSKPEKRKKIILVGTEYFAPLTQQYQKLYESNLLKCSPDELFSIVDTKEEILSKINI